MLTVLLLLAVQRVQVTPAPEWDAVFARTRGWTGADGIFTIPLDGDDRAEGLARTDTLLWFSDTFIGEVLPNGTRRNTVMVNNTTAFLPRGSAPGEMEFWYRQDGEQPVSAFVPDTPNALPGEWYWPHDGIALDGVVHLFAHRFRRSTEGMGFARTGLALISLTAPARPPFAGAVQQDCPFYLPATAQRAEMIFGIGILANTLAAGAPAPDGYLYVYGVREDPFVKKLLCARVTPEQLTDWTAWRFWNGAAWDPDPERSAVLTERVSPELSMSPLPGGRFLLVYQADTISRTIAARVAATPVGPFGAQVELYTCPLPAQPGTWTYNAKAHPNLSGPRALLISYHVNAVDFWDHFRHADIYRPRFVRLSW